MKRIPRFSGAAGIVCALMAVAVLSGCSKEPAASDVGSAAASSDTAISTTAADTTPAATTTTLPGEPAAYPVRGWCSEDSVYVRGGPGKEYGAIGGAHKGEQFSVLGREGDWYKVQHGEDEGYISAQFIRFSLDEAMATTAAETTATAAETVPEDSAVPEA